MTNTLDKVENKPQVEAHDSKPAAPSHEAWSSMDTSSKGWGKTERTNEPQTLEFNNIFNHTHNAVGDRSNGVGAPGDTPPTDDPQKDKPKPDQQDNTQPKDHNNPTDNGKPTDDPNKPCGDAGDKPSKVTQGADPQPFKPDQIKPDGVDQTGLGDCWYMASVAALASTPKGQQEISNMMKRNDDGSYTVTFPGDKDHPVNVTQADMKNDKINDSQEWAKVMEAALLKRDPKGAHDGADQKDALQLLTGQNMNEDKIFSGTYSSDLGRLRNSIQADLAKGEPVVAATNHEVKSGALEHNHAYTVTNYDPKTDTITLRNPWGHNNTPVGETKDGVTVLPNGEVKMSMQTFMDNYHDVAYQDQPKSTVQQAGQVVSDITHKVINGIGDLFS